MEVVRAVAYRFGRWNRGRKARFAVAVGDRANVRSVLLVGVSGERNPVNNLIEDELALHFPFVVASGITEGDATGWEPYVVADGKQLPFGDGSFDLVYANAVIEHVGGRRDQRRFVHELARVGRTWVITTPNRYFPIEAHFHTFLTHWSSRWGPRGSVTRLLGRRDLAELLPHGTVRGFPVISPTLTAVGQSSSRITPSRGEPSR